MAGNSVGLIDLEGKSFAEAFQDLQEAYGVEAFETIDIKDGTIVVIHGDMTKEALERLSIKFIERGLKDVLIISLRNGESIKELSEAELKASGLVRV